MHTHYDNLRVTRNATHGVIKAAYRALSQEFHPDKNPGRDTTRIMKIINEAYAVLSDPAARARYDTTLAGDERQSSSAQRAAEAAERQRRAGEAEAAAKKRREDEAAEHKRQAEAAPKKIVEECSRALGQLGYRLAQKAVGWEVREPLGGRARIGSLEDLVDYTKSKQFQNRQRGAADAKDVVEESNPKSVEECTGVLAQLGYRLAKKAMGWEVREPLGGRARIGSLEELIDYTKSKQIQGSRR
ncbi:MULTISPECIES: J domain-containing protein [Paraburkholderia]|uniref:J domain-containing protein n=1 Tax=Paraburkholderia madseniana TaxID=2599607 RepID=A0AAP5BLW1_9BURK|nr:MULTISPECIES: J domain-containing protein [Paraburkholderia]MCX4152235.1 J domain-containing protein [Paraburkholderia madseniana]MDN7155163.1 J domain-containing protein [Paraburkholderia sp. WS6]MDQ6414046.1 J domain-containing protein [Paraburkholderia madseniana]